MVIRRNNGVTLTELLVVVAIIGALAMLGPPLITQITKFFILGKTKVELQREARATMYLITRELRQAQSNNIIIDQAAGQPYYSRLTFTNTQGTTLAYYQNGSNLMLQRGTTLSTLSTNLAYLAFTFPRSDDLTIVSVSLTLQKQIYSGNLKALHMASEKVRVMD
jgi:prepilin-type N-terminal cleavage/methylation domain-containing protein